MPLRPTAFSAVFLMLLTAAEPTAPRDHPLHASSPDDPQPLANKLQVRVASFDAANRPLAQLALALAYEYKLPMAFEHVDEDALRKPLGIRLRGSSLHDVVAAIVASLPEYRVDLSGGLVDIYTPAGRSDPSNLLNTVIESFDVTELDTHLADAELLCALARQLRPGSGCGGSVAGGQWGSLKITLHTQGTRVYEILNAIVAQNGGALWVPIPPPRKQSSVMMNLWYIYPLDPAFESTALSRLRSTLPQQASTHR
ncbi:MAG TPA: hypothetical protein VG204_05015 [Terriglobia bacterium]|nr:hypothetical protein [Terriglobia bacterium]